LFFIPETETVRSEFWANTKLEMNNRIGRKNFDIVIDLRWQYYFIIWSPINIRILRVSKKYSCRTVERELEV